jgi:hypothetical protein
MSFFWRLSEPGWRRSRRNRPIDRLDWVIGCSAPATGDLADSVIERSARTTLQTHPVFVLENDVDVADRSLLRQRTCSIDKYDQHEVAVGPALDAEPENAGNQAQLGAPLGLDQFDGLL